MAKFTVITPVFNGSEYIEETVRSVLAAVDGMDYEYLVIDDGSTDNTRELLERYSAKLQYVYQENSGQSAAINKAIELATGVYATIVNADDPLITKSLFLDAQEIMDKNSQVVATYPDWNMIDTGGRVIETVKVKEFDLIELVGKFNCLIGPGGVFRTEVGKEINGWDASYRFVPDYDFWLRLSDYGVFRHVPHVQATWRTHKNSISISSRGQSMADERIRVINQYLIRNPDTPKGLRNMAVANANYRAAVLTYFDTRINGRKILLKSIRAYPKIVIEKDFRVTLFILLLPFSRLILNLVSRKKSFQNIEEKIRKKINS